MSSNITVQIASPLLESNYQKIFSDSTILLEFKRKVELIVGVYQADQQLVLLNAEGKFQKELNAESETLAQAGVQNNWIIKVTSKTGDQLNLDGNVEAFKLDEDKYKQRSDNARDFMAKMKEQLKPHIAIGKRCVVRAKGKPDRVGTIKFIGQVHFKPEETMVGVELDEASGKHDGEVDGQRYFQCKTNHGAFISHKQVGQLQEQFNGNGNGVPQQVEPMEL